MNWPGRLVYLPTPCQVAQTSEQSKTFQFLLLGKHQQNKAVLTHVCRLLSASTRAFWVHHNNKITCRPKWLAGKSNRLTLTDIAPMTANFQAECKTCLLQNKAANACHYPRAVGSWGKDSTRTRTRTRTTKSLVATAALQKDKQQHCSFSGRTQVMIKRGCKKGFFHPQFHCFMSLCEIVQ